MTSYIQVVNQLPLPTELQTREFAEFVAGAKRWEMLLKAFEPTEFVFYLDPNAGRLVVHTDEFGATFVDQGQSVAQCRERFGYWNYDSAYSWTEHYATVDGVADTAGPDRYVLSPEGEFVHVSRIPERTVKGVVVDMLGPGLRVHSKGEWIEISEPYGRGIVKRTDKGKVDTAAPGLCVESPEGQWVNVTESLVRAGTAQVLSLMYDPYARFHEQRPQYILKLRPGGVAFTRHDIANAKYRADVVNRLSKWHAEAEVGASLLPSITLLLRDADRREMTEVWREVGAAFDRERERQIEGMVAAMQRFLAAATL